MGADASQLDPGAYATQCAIQAGLHPPTLRVLMHAVVDQLRPEGPVTYRISHRADVRQLFGFLDYMLRMGVELLDWIMWILYIHLVSRTKPIEIARGDVSAACTKTKVRKTLLKIKKKCTIGETLWDTRRPTGGIQKALQVLDGYPELKLFAEKLATLSWTEWRPHRMDAWLSSDVPLLGRDRYHRGKTLRFLSDAAKHISGRPVVWQRQDLGSHCKDVARHRGSSKWFRYENIREGSCRLPICRQNVSCLEPQSKVASYVLIRPFLRLVSGTSNRCAT